MNLHGAFSTQFLVTQFFGVVAVILMAVYMAVYSGGLDWSRSTFQYHPLFMTLGLVFFYGDAMLVYRLFRNQKKIVIKVVHTALQLVAFGLSVTALVAVFTSHYKTGKPNMYSLHSWVGLTTVILFCAQFVIGFVFYLLPVLSEELKARYLPLHQYWGVTLFCMAIASCLMGIMEHASANGFYNTRSSQAYVANFAGVFIVVFGWAVTYLVSRPEYKRNEAQAQGYRLQK